MNEKIIKDVRFLKAYAVFATVLISCLFFLALSRGNNQKFAEIDVERINIVEKDGQLRMVISNKERQHPGIVDGKVIERTHPRPPGMLFFNHLGDEMGGLVFDENGGKGHFGSLTFDKVGNDQTIGFRHLEGDNGTYLTGLEMWQQPDISSAEVSKRINALRKIKDKAKQKAAIQAMYEKNELATRRVFLGKYRNNDTCLILCDRTGKTRIRISVTAEGDPSLEFLDKAGKVVQRFPKQG